MSTDKKDLMSHLLASREGLTLRNIKFCRGDKEVITREEFSQQVCKIVDQRADGIGTHTPAHSEAASIDVREWLADISR